MEDDAAQDVWHLDTWKLLDQAVTFSEQSMQLNGLTKNWEIW